MYDSITMPISSQEYKKGEKAPGAFTYRPEWELESFEAAMTTFAKRTPTDDDEITWNLSADSGKSDKWKDYNMSEEAAKSGNRNFFVVSETNSKSSELKNDSKMSSLLDKVDFQLSFKAIRSFDISPGAWNANLDTYQLKDNVVLGPGATRQSPDRPRAVHGGEIHR